jgi:hypothetical protein
MGLVAEGCPSVLITFSRESPSRMPKNGRILVPGGPVIWMVCI